MILSRAVLLSSSDPAPSTGDVLAACHNYPSRNTQSGVGGKLVAFGRQFALLLEGPPAALDGLVARLAIAVPEAELSVRVRAAVEERAFRTWSITDVYLDELALDDPAAAEAVTDTLVDLLAPAKAEAAAEANAEPELEAEPADEGAEVAPSEEATDPFARIADLLRKPAAPARRELVAA